MNDIYDTAMPQLSSETEKERIRVLRSLQILDTPYEQLYDDITKIASSIMNTKAACISFVDENRVWFKSLKGAPSNEINRSDSFCHYTVAGDGLFEVRDTSEHEQFKTNPYVTGEPHWKYYAGVPLKIKDHVNVGALCLLDTKPNKLSKEQENTLSMLAETVVHLISMRRNLSDYDNSQHLLQVLQEINEDFIQSPESKFELFKKMLDYVLQVTGSEYGFIGEVFSIEGKRVLRTYVITDVSKENEGRGFTSDPAQRGMVFGDYNTLFGHTLRTGESIICNSIDCDSKQGAVPDGHPLLGCYMGLAINDSKGNLIGVMGLANKPAGYSEADRTLLQPFLSACGTMIISLRSIQRRAEIEDERNNMASKLIKAQAIAKLGSWEYDMATNKVHWSDELYTIYEIPKTQEALDYKLYHGRLHPEDIERNDAIATAAIRERKEFSFEERLLFPDGRTKIVQVTGFPVCNEQDIVVGIHGTTQDITAQKRQEEVLQRFFNLAVDLFCIVSKEGLLLRHSLSFRSVLGYTEEDLRNMPLFELIHPEDRDRTRMEIDFILRGGTSRNFENRYKRKNGEFVILSWTTTFDEESQLVYASAQNVTEKRVLEESLIESQIEAEKSKAKDIFLANMSHEIRTPLNAIIGFNDILSQTALTAEQRKNVDFISGASKKLSVLINDILDISKLESGKLDLEHAPFRLEEVARSVVQMYTLKARSKGVKLLFSYDQEIPEVLMGDETRLSQILLNLISNAVKFTEHGSIELRILEERHSDSTAMVYFEVKDTGIGIAQEKLDVIFERFTQAESYTTRVYGGTGLGLNIVRSLVDLHNGHLEVESAPGIGSTFRFSIEYPIASANEILQMEGPKQNMDNQLLSDMRILLVEDNEHNQILAETYLLNQRATVEIAGNGKVAIEMLKHKSYDAILMDIQMPIMDGLTTTEVLRNELKIETPVIACSAHAMTSERLKCKEVGMNDYISKPYTQEGLVSVLAKYRKPKQLEALSNVDEFTEVLDRLEERMSMTYVQKIIRVFKQRLPGEIEMLKQAVEVGNLKLMEERAHYQSGSMSSLKFKRGHMLAYDAEQAAAGKDIEKASSACVELTKYLQDLLNFLNTSVN